MTTVYNYTNGFRLVYETSYTSIPITEFHVFIKFGSIHENENIEKGIAHFIEHMCFKGTLKMPDTRQISMVYDKIGAYVNAYTQKEYTCFTVRCSDEHAAKCIDVLSDMILHSKMNVSHYKLEKNIVKEEMIRSNDSPENLVLDTTDALVFKDTQYENPIDTLSYHTDKNSLSYSSLIKLYTHFYQPNNMGISVISNLSFQTIKKMIEKTRFIKRTNTGCHPMIYSMPRTTDIQYSIIQKKGATANYFNISFRTCEYGHKDMYCLNILELIIGGYMSSRMFMLLREQNGITYESSCSLSSYKYFGNISLYAVCEDSKLCINRKNIGLIMLLIQLLNNLIKNGITEKELKESKGNIKGSMLQNMGSTQTIAQYNGLECLIYESPHVSYDKIYKKYYDKLTKHDINRVIQTYFTRNNMCVVIVGEHVPELSLVKKYFTKFVS
jgi:predicted Zn-dependent peptidase